MNRVQWVSNILRAAFMLVIVFLIYVVAGMEW